ncbi:MAG: OmpA family protein, partial [Bacteroidia bacterium]
NKKNDLYFFEKEHNSAWYYFNVMYDGDLVLEITPSKSDDDYDFLLFKWTDSSFCRNLVSKKTLPVRTNLARTGKDDNGVTGLSGFSDKEFIHAGPGKTFSKSLPVKKGERYYLVLDNVYHDGGGHIIKLGYEKEVQINGIILNDDNQPIKAEVILADEKGKEVAKTESDSITGKYNMTVKLWESAPYTISFENDSFFIDSKQITTDYKLNDIKTVLPKLKGGKKYTLGGINFYGNLPVLLPESHASVNALYRLMKKNKNMVIRIEGHVNDPNFTSEPAFRQELSEHRATTIYNYLVSRNIAKERMSIIGFGNKYMLYPHPKNEEEEGKNMRVEINVISIK